jgi:two-component system, chemotaxis family, chemotaxis protein CheV
LHIALAAISLALRRAPSAAIRNAQLLEPKLMGLNANSPLSGSGILLEAGTNELEILVIRVGDWRLGVNVAKVREVLKCDRPTRIPQCHPAVEGSVRIREEVLPLVNLAKALSSAEEISKPTENDRMLVMEFNQQRLAFRVHEVDRIVRVSWSSVLGMPQLASGVVPVTGVIRLGERLVQLLDFETVGSSVGMGRLLADREAVEAAPAAPEHLQSRPIVLAEDSVMVREMVKDTLAEAGYNNVFVFNDGAAAWEHLQKVAGSQTAASIREQVAVVITDVEMPRMDGLRLTRSIREHAVLSQVPVVIFSSIVSKDNEKKGCQVGATAQVTKPRYAELKETLAEVLAASA